MPRAQREITLAGPLLDARHRLMEKGWARKPLRDYDPSQSSRMRLKEWDYLGVFTGDHFLTVMVTHLGYLAVGACQLLDLVARRKMIERVAASPFGLGCRMSRSSLTGESRIEILRRSVRFNHADTGREVHADWPAAARRPGLRVRLNVMPPPKGHDSIVMCTPIGDRGFYYNHKVSGLRVSGSVEEDGRRFNLAGDALATLDWGRGVWAWKTFWNWATACGRTEDGRDVRLNLGCGFGDLSAATENCFFVDGRITKLEDVTFDCDRKNLEKPWTFRSDDSSLDLTLEPVYLNTKHTNLGLARSVLHQVFGRFSGTLRLGREQIKIRALRGWAEEHHARW
ncbi:MAG: DUF2804 domain-containing protein [Nitrospirae bacterium]|nr:DUF2804 domain-containing protein [Nitrospirota bacterium]